METPAEILKSKFNLFPQVSDDESDDAADAVVQKARKESAKAIKRSPRGEEEETLLEEQPSKEIVETTPERPLNKSEVSVRLSWLGKTADGDGYTYLKATCTGLKLTSILAIKAFKHLQFVNLSDNLLTLEALQPVTELPYLLLIHADKNLLDSAALNKCKYLQVIIMNNNKITSMEDIFQPELSTLELGNNFIEKIKFINRMPTLRVLDFRNNIIQDIADVDFPNLDSLYLAGNKIKELVGISKLPNLRILHVRGNPIRFLNGFETPLPKLTYLNLRNTKILTLRQIRKLKDQPALETLILKGTFYMGGEGRENPEAAAEEEDVELRVEVLATLPRLKRLNKQIFTPEERQEAKDLMQQWLEEGEKDEDEELLEELGGEEEEEEDSAP